MCALLPRRRGSDATGRCGDGDAVAAKRKMSELTHLDQSGAAHMVDVSGKAITARQAIAHGRISMSVEARDAIAQGLTKKGDVLRSEEHTSELQSLMRISYAVFCL